MWCDTRRPEPLNKTPGIESAVVLQGHFISYDHGYGTPQEILEPGAFNPRGVLSPCSRLSCGMGSRRLYSTRLGGRPKNDGSQRPRIGKRKHVETVPNQIKPEDRICKRQTVVSYSVSLYTSEQKERTTDVRSASRADADVA
ncbi:hypothetical protein M413DRAFT_446945 [Hebeloma cylindrosporum]|uniref:Uncharacterized protein n=1 Tax=Hebeloma cylindrosporum TaxID=76867 RepID=A0A0C3C763_HEBCY|nr:hypothetical protein M413DRAFT_446945 [Hebeloma cylindrosporum h7]